MTISPEYFYWWGKIPMPMGVMSHASGGNIPSERNFYGLTTCRGFQFVGKVISGYGFLFAVNKRRPIIYRKRLLVISKKMLHLPRICNKSIKWQKDLFYI